MNEDQPTQDERLALAEAQASSAISRYREILAAAPNLIPSMVQGNTIEEIDASAEAARQAYTTISRQIAQTYERNIPAANPARSAQTPGAETLKPEAKIALGLQKARF